MEVESKRQRVRRGGVRGWGLGARELVEKTKHLKIVPRNHKWRAPGNRVIQIPPAALGSSGLKANRNSQWSQDWK